MASMKPKKSSLPPPKRTPRQSITVGKERERNGRVIIGIVVAAVVVLGVVIALVVGGGDGEDTTDGVLDVARCSAEEGGDVTDAADVTVGEFVEGEDVQPVGVAGDPLDEFTSEGTDTARCERAPIVSGYDYDGNPITIDPAADGLTLVVLLAHWCPHCNAEIPRLNEWRDAGDVPEGLNVVGVSTAVRADQANYPPDRWLVDVHWQWPVLADNAEMAAFGAYGGASFPTLIVIGSDGRVLARIAGELSADEVDQLISNAVEADPGEAGAA